MKFFQDVGHKGKTRGRPHNQLLDGIKLQKAVPRFEVGLLFWRVEKLVWFAWHGGLRYFPFFSVSAARLIVSQVIESFSILVLP